jgi:hypothetical protein
MILVDADLRAGRTVFAGPIARLVAGVLAGCVLAGCVLAGCAHGPKGGSGSTPPADDGQAFGTTTDQGAMSGGVPIEVVVGTGTSGDNFNEVDVLPPNTQALIRVAFNAAPQEDIELEVYFESTSELVRPAHKRPVPRGHTGFFYIPFTTRSGSSGAVTANHVFVGRKPVPLGTASSRRVGAIDDFSIRQ